MLKSVYLYTALMAVAKNCNWVNMTWNQIFVPLTIAIFIECCKLTMVYFSKKKYEDTLRKIKSTLEEIKKDVKENNER